ncbi:MAG: universal stress protein [Dehalobacterium sp.]|jgi:nucleotide-binding universal stress UspA family protein
MKMLVCVDGSELSMKAVGEAAKIAGACDIHEVSIIYVCESKLDWQILPSDHTATISKEDIKRMHDYVFQCDYDKNQKILLEAKEVFAKNNIEAKTIFKEGHPAQTIIDIANEEGYDLVVMGSRGLGGLKKLFLGSVSSAVIQEVKSNVYLVK